MSELELTLEQAEANLAEAQAELLAAEETITGLKKGDFEALMPAVEARKKAVAAVDKAKQAIDYLNWEATNGERLALVERLQKVDFVLPDLFVEAFAAGVKSIRVAVTEDGTVTVTADAGIPPKPGTRKRTSGGGGGGTRKAHVITYNGVSGLKSREFLAAVVAGGGEHAEDAAKALDAATNWREPKWGKDGNTPMTSAPGFDAAVKRLVPAVGATFE